MESISRQAFLFLLALISLSVVFCILISTPIHAGEHPFLLLAVATEPLAPPINWVDDLEQRLKTDFTVKYPTYDFAPYEQELDRIRSAVNRGDRWGAKREMGRFLKMLTSHAYGLGDDAAEELAVISHRIMPEEEFGIIYPGSKAEPYTNGVFHN